MTNIRVDPNFGDPNARPAIALIPLALSERGIRAIESACVPGLIEEILDHSRPIYTRMVHSADEKGNLSEIPMPYGPNGEVCESYNFPARVCLIILKVSAHFTARKDRKASSASPSERAQRYCDLQSQAHLV